ncbi:MAG: hypothetical protein C4324_09655 [Blastocatellia bacterium]
MGLPNLDRKELQGFKLVEKRPANSGFSDAGFFAAAVSSGTLTYALDAFFFKTRALSRVLSSAQLIKQILKICRIR